jgi:hypothetical protein
MPHSTSRTPDLFTTDTGLRLRLKRIAFLAYQPREDYSSETVVYSTNRLAPTTKARRCKKLRCWCQRSPAQKPIGSLGSIVGLTDVLVTGKISTKLRSQTVQKK